MAEAARVAIYYAPSPNDRLAIAGANWLGRDADRNIDLAQPPVPEIAALTQEPRRYGFHATLKPPMRLAPGSNWFALLSALHVVAASIPPFDLPPLHVADLHGFLALREAFNCAPLQALCDRCVADLDAFRTPPDASELQRRRQARLSPQQDAMLQRWGYPYVFDTWFFHMTLTRRLDEADKARVKPLAEAFFADALAMPRQVRDICVFTQAAPDADFVVAERIPLRG